MIPPTPPTDDESKTPPQVSAESAKSDDTPSEVEIARRCAEGDAAAWELFVDRYGPLIRAIVRRLLRHYSGRAADVDTDEIVADVLLALVRRDRALFRKYRPEFRLSTYLGVIARTETLRWLRRRRRTPLPIERAARVSDPSPMARPDRLLSDADRASALEELRNGLHRLKDRDRLLLTMRYLDGCEYKTIARVLSLNPQSIGQLIHRAKTRLAKALPHLEQRIADWE